MNILGIETSCDETAASVVRDGCQVLSNVVVSSLKEHARYGGVIPEIASRRQLECINQVVDEALLAANLNLKDIDAVAVTQSPGLIGSLLVGISFARALSFAIQKPLIDVNHIEAHLYANFLELPGKAPLRLSLPAVGLVVSGGHTSLYLIKDFKNYKLLGQTRDDAAGEAFDKVARILDLGYPGGPAIDRLAQKGQQTSLKFQGANLPDSLDFSFSGVKTAVLYQQQNKTARTYPREEVAYAFQKSVVDVLVSKCLLACKKLRVKTILVGGGVAANSELRRELTDQCQKNKITISFPPMALCLDNAAMIAGLGYQHI